MKLPSYAYGNRAARHAQTEAAAPVRLRGTAAFSPLRLHRGAHHHFLVLVHYHPAEQAAPASSAAAHQGMSACPPRGDPEAPVARVLNSCYAGRS